MKKILVIGSTVVDVIIHVDHLPCSTEDVHVLSQTAALGGCAYNVSEAVRQFGAPYILFSPIGTGIYGDFIRSEFAKKRRVPVLPTPDMDNGCCYCFVEKSGERTFISNHGAEYLIYEKWLSAVDPAQLGSVYICGLEIEEKTGEDIVRFLETLQGVPIYFAPGPRLGLIDPDRMQRIFDLSPIIHLNADEICRYTCKNELEQAAASLYARTGNTIIITSGAKGACYYQGGPLVWVDACPVDQVVDTIGAGDAHIGACMANLALGQSLDDALRAANRLSAAVVAHSGAVLPDDQFDRILGNFKIQN